MTEEIKDPGTDLAEVRDEELKEFYNSYNIDSESEIRIKLSQAGAVNLIEGFMELLKDLTAEMNKRGI